MKLSFPSIALVSALTFTSCDQTKSKETPYEIPEEKPTFVSTKGPDTADQATSTSSDTPPKSGNPDNSTVTDLTEPPAPAPAPPELDELKGAHTKGKLFLRYSVSNGDIKKWNINAPYEIKVTDAYIEVLFSGNYYIDGVATGEGKKRLFIKKENIHTIFVAE